MDLTQRKLSQKEWESLEVPVLAAELRILKLIQDGYGNVSNSFNDSVTLMNFIKIKSDKLSKYHMFLYNEYLKREFNDIIKRHKFKMPKSSVRKKAKAPKLNKADMIRIKNTDKKLRNIRESIFEYLLLDSLDKFFKSKDDARNKHYYTMVHLLEYKVSNLNTIIIDKLTFILKFFSVKVDKCKFIYGAYNYIERNNALIKYKDVKLYTHQKDLFTHCKAKEPKLILYQAPTGTGKTLSPIGLSKGHRIIFVCAAKHVGLQLAKSCISVDIKVAVAFGCKDPGNIRLHWAAAKETVRNRRTGGIFRVDNSVGDYVDIMISDVQSYLPAMHYMKAFNKVEDMILFWDEPTITLDYKEHPYHAVLSKNWKENDIPNIVLSSATLPPIEELEGMSRSFMRKFKSTNIISLISHSCSKTIPILDAKGRVVLPHFVFSEFSDIKRCIRHLRTYKTLLRHFDIREVTRFIEYVNKNISIKDRYKIDSYFETIESIDTISIKEYYLALLGSLRGKYEAVFKFFNDNRKPLYSSSIRITTSDAYTLTDGPTIYLADDVEKIATFCLRTAEIPAVMLDSILEDMGTNEGIRQEIESIMRDINKNKDKKEEIELKRSKGSLHGKSRNAPRKAAASYDSKKEQQQMERCEYLRAGLRRVRLGLKFIPNSRDHLKHWNRSKIRNAFTSSIDDAVVEKIMLLDVAPSWKILLLMGIGVFTQHKCDDYVAIMKDLALHQKLYLIIASTDYIYGTNYQFCHGYIGKDLGSLSQEKLIQAFGRIGRADANQDYSIRLRNSNVIQKLFQKSANKIEVINMNRLFV